MKHTGFWRVAALLATGFVSGPAWAVEHIVLDVVENDTGNTAASVTVTKRSGSSNVAPYAVPNSRGDYGLVVRNPSDGEAFLPANDLQNGVFLVGTYQLFSQGSVLGPGGVPDIRISAPAIHANINATTGEFQYFFVSNNDSPGGAEWNADVAAVYFPFNEGWFAGHAFNAANGDVLNTIAGPSGVATQGPVMDLNTPGVDGAVEVVDRRALEPTVGGITDFYVPGVVDARRQGVMFVSHGKNEDNFGLAGPSLPGINPNTGEYGTHYVGYVMDTGSGGGTEQDPLAYAFIPTGTEGVVMGRVSGHGVPMLSSGDYNVSLVPNDNGVGFKAGTYRIDIPGQSPDSGTVLINAERWETGYGSGTNNDNIVTIEPTADGGWIVETRDLPSPNNGLQSVSNAASFHFAFFPNEGGPTTPGAIKPLSDFGYDITLSSVIGGNVAITEHNAGNNLGDMSAQFTSGTKGMIVPSVNRGDLGLGQEGDYLPETEGVLFATLTQNFRDNSATGGIADRGVITTSHGDAVWQVHTHQANGNTGGSGEHNINFSAVYFQANSGYETEVDFPTIDGKIDVLPSIDVTSVSTPSNLAGQGLLMVNGYGNVDNYATVGVVPDGEGGAEKWDVQLRDNAGYLEPGTVGVNYVWLPYATEGMVGGRIGSDGAVLSSSQDGGAPNFQLTRTGDGTYELYIPGVTPDDGMLLLNAANGGDSVTIPLDPDFNDDNFVDAADYTVWRDSLGQTGADLAADANADGVVDDADYDLWKSSYGAAGPFSDLQQIDGGAMMSYEAGVNSEGQEVFIIQTLGVSYLATMDGVLVPDSSEYEVASSEFQFAFIAFDNVASAGLTVPEPSTAAAAAIALLSFGFRRTPQS